MPMVPRRRRRQQQQRWHDAGSARTADARVMQRERRLESLGVVYNIDTDNRRRDEGRRVIRHFYGDAF